jgi:hypothetical protein
MRQALKTIYMAKYVKTELPVRQPETTLHLCDRINIKHTADGIASALQDVIDMVVFGNLVNDVKDKRLNAELKDGQALDKYDKANHNAGLAAGQNKDTDKTIAWFARQVKDILLVKHSGNEEALNSYGFPVIISTTGARKNIKIELPEELKEMIELGEAIVAHHTFLGVASPLTAALVDMAAFETLVGDARTLYNEWEVLRGEIEALNNDAITTLGYGAGQTISTTGTVYHELGKIRRRLLQKHHGKEEALSNWGFKVKITESTTGRKKGSKAISIKGKVTDSETDSPLANALVYVQETDTFTLTDAEGNFTFEKLAAGTYTIQAHKNGYADFGIDGVEVAAGTPTNLDIEMTAEATGTASGLVTKTGVGAMATVSALGVPGSTNTDPSGNFNLPLPAGDHTLRATLNPDNVTMDKYITILPGGSLVVNFEFP